MFKQKITYKGRKVTLRGVGFGRYHNLILAHTGLLSVRRRLSRGIGAFGKPMPPLKPHYAKRKRHSNIRDLWLTGQMLRNLSVRWASATRAVISLTSRKARQKGIRHQRFSQWLGWAPSDKKAVIERARELHKAEVNEFRKELQGGRRSRRPIRFAMRRSTGLQRFAA